MDFYSVENKYRPTPMWLWNSKLNISDTVSFAQAMSRHGFGGFTITSFCGYSGNYLSDDWLRNISAAHKCAADNSMSVCLSDKIPGYSSVSNNENHLMNLEFQQKFLRCESGEKTNDRTIICSDGYHFYYDVDSFSPDVFCANSVYEYIEKAFAPYLENPAYKPDSVLFQSDFFNGNNIPWSFDLPAKYKDAYEEELLDVLAELFHPVGNYKSTRFKFWTLISSLYENNFLQPLYSWAQKNDIKLKVLFDHDNTCSSFINACTVRKFLYSDIPCSKADSPEEVSPFNALTTSSIAQQIKSGDSCVLLYGSSGHTHTFEEFKRMAQQYLVRGVNLISPCYLSYSLEGFRKNTVSTPMILQEFREKENKKFNDSISRVSKILSEGKIYPDTLLIHNQLKSLSLFDSINNSGLKELVSDLDSTIKDLEQKHIPFHIGDEFVLQKHARVENGYLVVGKQRYSTVVIPDNATLLDSTSKLLSEFEHKGGFITLSGSLKPNTICDNSNLLYTMRQYPDYRIHYFVNNSSSTFTAAINEGSKMLDVFTGEVLPFFGVYKFNAYESLVVIDDGTAQPSRPYSKPLKTLDISGDWHIEKLSNNFLLLDKCDLFINGELFEKNCYAEDVNDILCKNEDIQSAECVYHFDTEKTDTDVFLSYRDSGSIEIKINDVAVSKDFEPKDGNDIFQKLKITHHLHPGRNSISLYSKSPVNPKLNSRYERAGVNKAELNKVYYKTEFTSIYLQGDFSVETSGDFRSLDKKAVRYIGDFKISERRKFCTVSRLEKQSFPFFAGEITLSKTFNLSDTSYCIKFSPESARSITLEVNGTELDTLICSPYEYDVSSYLTKGDNEIKITLTSNLRNLFGPHHKPLGELHKVINEDYYKMPSIWTDNKLPPWEDNYCLVEFGIDPLE